jgi:hypothetical protein
MQRTAREFDGAERARRHWTHWRGNPRPAANATSRKVTDGTIGSKPAMSSPSEVRPIRTRARFVTGMGIGIGAMGDLGDSAILVDDSGNDVQIGRPVVEDNDG